MLVQRSSYSRNQSLIDTRSNGVGQMRGPSSAYPEGKILRLSVDQRVGTHESWLTLLS